MAPGAFSHIEASSIDRIADGSVICDEADTLASRIPSLPASVAGRKDSSSPRTAGPAVTGADGQPLVYPVPLFIRNTFIDIADRQLSMEDFLPTREAVSCPTSKLSQFGSGCDEVRERALGLNIRLLPQADEESSLDDTRSECSTADTAEYFGEYSSEYSKQSLLMPAVLPSPELPQTPPVELVVGSEECPTVGSLGHSTGDCKPCAFVSTRGCGSGKDCKFCHLCDAGEKKKRQKAKRQFFGAMRAMERAALAEAQALEEAEALAQSNPDPFAYQQGATLESFVFSQPQDIYAMPR